MVEEIPSIAYAIERVVANTESRMQDRIAQIMEENKKLKAEIEDMRGTFKTLEEKIELAKSLSIDTRTEMLELKEACQRIALGVTSLGKIVDVRLNEAANERQQLSDRIDYVDKSIVTTTNNLVHQATTVHIPGKVSEQVAREVPNNIEGHLNAFRTEVNGQLDEIKQAQVSFGNDKASFEKQIEKVRGELLGETGHLMDMLQQQRNQRRGFGRS